VLAVASVAAAALVAGACTASPGGQQAALLPAGPTTTLASGPDGPYAVGERTEVFVDRTRGTDANGAFPAKPDRTLETLVFYPAEGTPGGDPLKDGPGRAAGRPYPLVVFAHGFTAFAGAYRNLIRWWAAAGYVVAAPTFPLSSGNAPGGPNAADYRNQPADVSFVIDEMLRINGDVSHPLAGMVDPARIGVSGHSLGGLTTYGVAFNECCIDTRIKAAVPMSGLRAAFRTSRYFPLGADTPVLIIHGDRDSLVSVDQAHTAFGDAHRPKYLLLLHGEDHVIPFVTGRATPAGSLVIDGSIDFFDHYLKGHADGIDRLRAAARAEGSAELQVDAG
jgi:dienelactone hydrolase